MRKSERKARGREGGKKGGREEGPWSILGVGRSSPVPKRRKNGAKIGKKPGGKEGEEGRWRTSFLRATAFALLSLTASCSRAISRSLLGGREGGRDGGPGSGRGSSFPFSDPPGFSSSPLGHWLSLASFPTIPGASVPACVGEPRASSLPPPSPPPSSFPSSFHPSCLNSSCKSAAGTGGKINGSERGRLKAKGALGVLPPSPFFLPLLFASLPHPHRAPHLRRGVRPSPLPLPPLLPPLKPCRPSGYSGHRTPRCSSPSLFPPPRPQPGSPGWREKERPKVACEGRWQAQKGRQGACLPRKKERGKSGGQTAGGFRCYFLKSPLDAHSQVFHFFFQSLE